MIDGEDIWMPFLSTILYHLVVLSLFVSKDVLRINGF